MALLPIVGDESGDAWSARVEWWRLVAAREKSRPLDLRGRMFVGDAYVCEWSRLGESGAAFAWGEYWRGVTTSRWGSCSGGPRWEKLEWTGVEGAGATSRIVLSSFDWPREAANMNGEGESFGVPPPSDNDRVLVTGDLSIRPPPPPPATLPDSST